MTIKSVKKVLNFNIQHLQVMCQKTVFHVTVTSLLPTSLHGIGSFLRSYQSLSSSRNSLLCMEREGSLSQLQEPATDAYPESNVVQTFPSSFPKMQSNITLPSTHSLLSGLFPSEFLIKIF